MPRTVCIIQGHPDGTGKHLCHAIVDAYADGAKAARAEVRRVDLGNMVIPLLRDPADFLSAPPAAIATSTGTAERSASSSSAPGPLPGPATNTIASHMRSARTTHPRRLPSPMLVPPPPVQLLGMTAGRRDREP